MPDRYVVLSHAAWVLTIEALAHYADALEREPRNGSRTLPLKIKRIRQTHDEVARQITAGQEVAAVILGLSDAEADALYDAAELGLAQQRVDGVHRLTLAAAQRAIDKLNSTAPTTQS